VLWEHSQIQIVFWVVVKAFAQLVIKITLWPHLPYALLALSIVHFVIQHKIAQGVSIIQSQSMVHALQEAMERF